ncbi:c-type cytochrome [Terasakiella pusilla]|uniref:c-type cytochrome n=1 Tax=Terasakiella pusilla TaxID=64973 RepID=UPI003AA92747
MFHKTFLTVAISALLLSSFSANAHDGATGVVKERMDLMKSIGKNTKTIAPIAMGSMDMDLKTVEEGATNIAKAAKEALTKYPEGSLDDITEAKENIWTDWAKFEDLMKDLSSNAEALAKLAADGEEFELTDAFTKMAGTCKKCHMEFRVKKP